MTKTQVEWIHQPWFKAFHASNEQPNFSRGFCHTFKELLNLWGATGSIQLARCTWRLWRVDHCVVLHMQRLRKQVSCRLIPLSIWHMAQSFCANGADWGAWACGGVGGQPQVPPAVQIKHHIQRIFQVLITHPRIARYKHQSQLTGSGGDWACLAHDQYQG